MSFSIILFFQGGKLQQSPSLVISKMNLSATNLRAEEKKLLHFPDIIALTDNVQVDYSF